MSGQSDTREENLIASTSVIPLVILGCLFVLFGVIPALAVLITGVALVVSLPLTHGVLVALVGVVFTALYWGGVYAVERSGGTVDQLR